MRSLLTLLFALQKIVARSLSSPVSAQSTEKILKTICQDTSMVTVNKPNITVGVESQGGNVVPFSCIIKDRMPCENETLAFEAYQRPPHVNASNEVVNRKFALGEEKQQWTNKLQRRLRAALANITDIPPSEENLLNKLYSQLDYLKDIDLYARSTQKYKEGHCGELTSLAAKKLLKADEKYHLHLKIQVVVAYRQGGQGPVTDHQFLILNSNLNDVETFNRHDTINYLKHLTQGIVCDPWNKGLFVSIQKDQTGLYDLRAGWDIIKVTTLQLPKISKLTNLSAVKTLFCNELKKMHFNEACEHEELQFSPHYFKKPQN